MYEKIKNIKNIIKLDPNWVKFAKRLDKNHFINNEYLSREQQMELFKQSVDLVEYEPNAYCNRKCTFCPNVDLDRTHNHDDLDINIFNQSINNLNEISYSKLIRFALYSEPLASPITLEYIAIARNNLPIANIDVISNGDFLNEKMLADLKSAGLDILRISVYPKKYIWNKKEATIQLNKIAKRINIQPIKVQETKTAMVWSMPYDGMEIIATAKDLHNIGFDRAHTVEHLIDNSFIRTSPCRIVFNHFNIYHDGAITPCHNIRQDNPAHADYIIDYLDGEKSIFEVYTSQNFVSWRNFLADVSAKKKPCNSCKQIMCNTGRTEKYMLQHFDKEKLGLS